MSGLPCAKTIIDNGAAVQRSISCMSATVNLAATVGRFPSEQMESKFINGANQFALLCAEIEKEMGQGLTTHDSGDGFPVDRSRR